MHSLKKLAVVVALTAGIIGAGAATASACPQPDPTSSTASSYAAGGGLLASLGLSIGGPDGINLGALLAAGGGVVSNQ